jgi:tetratricopeptide (TPR) repeat protein
MTVLDAEIIEKYEALMKRDPHSKAFAPLAEAYLRNALPDRAEAVVRDGLRKHPDFAPGLIVYAKILKARSQFAPSLELLKKASRLAPENVLALQLQGDVCLELKKPREALKAYKMVLLLNPMATKARSMIQRLESLSAIDFDENTFAYAKLSNVEQMKQNIPIEQEGTPQDTRIGPQKDVTRNEATLKDPSLFANKALQRMLSLIDAFIARNDLVKASELIDESKIEFGAGPELSKRSHLVRSRGFSSQMTEAAGEKAAPLTPLVSREKQILKNKLEKLQMLLRKIDGLRI